MRLGRLSLILPELLGGPQCSRGVLETGQRRFLKAQE